LGEGAGLRLELILDFNMTECDAGAEGNPLNGLGEVLRESDETTTEETEDTEMNFEKEGSGQNHEL